MVSKLEKHGDGQALVLDKTLLDMLHIDANTPLQVQVSDGALIVTPVNEGNTHDETAALRDKHFAAPDTRLYPAPLMREYQALTDKKLRRTLSPQESVRLQEVRNEIAAMDEQQTQSNTWDIQAEKLRAELALLRAEVEALPDAPPADK